MSQNDAVGMANSVDPDQMSSLVWVCTVCSGISVQKLRIITVFYGVDYWSRVLEWSGIKSWCGKMTGLV